MSVVEFFEGNTQYRGDIGQPFSDGVPTNSRDHCESFARLLQTREFVATVHVPRALLSYDAFQVGECELFVQAAFERCARQRCGRPKDPRTANADAVVLQTSSFTHSNTRTRAVRRSRREGDDFSVNASAHTDTANAVRSKHLHRRFSVFLNVFSRS